MFHIHDNISKINKLLTLHRSSGIIFVCRSTQAVHCIIPHRHVPFYAVRFLSHLARQMPNDYGEQRVSRPF